MFEKREKPLLSVIIPSWFVASQDGKYGKEETFTIADSCLTRLIKVKDKTSFRIELIIIDNGSTLDWPFVKDYFSKADKLIVNKENLGFAPAINEGVAVARGEFIMQINNDVLIWDGFFDKMVEDFREQETKLNPNIGLLMPAITKDKIDFWEMLEKDKSEIDMKTNAGIFGVKAEFGSCYMGRREIFKTLAANRDGYQVLDENFIVGFGEDRWAYREVRLSGMETYRNHNVRVCHVGNLSMSKLKGKPEIRELIDKNREYLEELKAKNNID